MDGSAWPVLILVNMFCSVCGSALCSDPPVSCLACGARHWANPKPSASALVVTAGRLLLIRRALPPGRGCWDIPGGFCNPGEHPIDTAVRETLEETGLLVAIIGFLGIWLDEYPSSAPQTGDSEAVVNIYYNAVPLDPTGARQPLSPAPVEAFEARWFLAASPPTRLAFPGHTHVLLAWRRAFEAGQLRTSLHDAAGRFDGTGPRSS